MKNSSEVFVMGTDGSNLRNLTNNNLQDASPQWSKDGNTIYFVSEREGARSVYVMNC